MSSPRVVTLCPGLVGKIEECWKPHEFRDVVKRAKQAFKPLEHLQVVLVRLDLVIEKKPCSDLNETLSEIREEVAEFISRNDFKNEVSPSEFTENVLRIFAGKKSYEEVADTLVAGRAIATNKDFIEKELTLQVYNETKRDKNETARRLGIPVGRLIQRLIRFGEEVPHGRF